MASAINDSIPVDGTDIDADPIRGNFASAKAEIEALQALVAPVSPPASLDAPGILGQWAWDPPYLYLYVDENKWVVLVPAQSLG